MTFYEFGNENKPVVVLIHPALVMWDYFEYVIPLLEEGRETDPHKKPGGRGRLLQLPCGKGGLTL